MSGASVAPLLGVTNLCIATAPRREPPVSLLEGLSFDMAPGEFLAIVGESGSGKTLAARAILDLLPSGVRRTAGSIALNGRELTTLTAAELRAVRGAEVGMVFQEPMASLNPALTIGLQLAEGLRLHCGLDKEEIHRRCVEMLSCVRIESPEGALRSYPHQFSGGMRQRLMLASVLLLKPKLLIADEPTTALDTLSQREVMELMVELARDAGVATLLITHDLGLVARYADRVLVVEKGHPVETGSTRDVLIHPTHAYTRRLVGSRPRRRACSVGTGSGCETGADQPAGVSSSPAPLLSIEKACIAYPGHRGVFRGAPPKAVVHDVDLSLRAGQIMALVGASGSGKSTLGRAVLGLQELTSGAIHFGGVRLGAMNAAQLSQFRAQAQLVFQDPFSCLDPRLRVGDIVHAPLRHDRNLNAATRRERVELVLHEVGLGGFGERFPHQMSGGQRQRVAIARAVVSRPRLVVADEPVSALDMTIQAQVLSLLQKLQAEYGFACLFITHDLSVVDQIADEVIVMSGGRIVERGPTRAVLDDPQHDYTRALLAATAHLPGEAQPSVPAD
jgi:peptide/nickel transport system ATP-binding protein